MLDLKHTTYKSLLNKGEFFDISNLLEARVVVELIFRNYASIEPAPLDLNQYCCHRIYDLVIGRIDIREALSAYIVTDRRLDMSSACITDTIDEFLGNNDIHEISFIEIVNRARAKNLFTDIGLP